MSTHLHVNPSFFSLGHTDIYHPIHHRHTQDHCFSQEPHVSQHPHFRQSHFQTSHLRKQSPPYPQTYLYQDQVYRQDFVEIQQQQQFLQQIQLQQFQLLQQQQFHDPYNDLYQQWNTNGYSNNVFPNAGQYETDYYQTPTPTPTPTPNVSFDYSKARKFIKKSQYKEIFQRDIDIEAGQNLEDVSRDVTQNLPKEPPKRVLEHLTESQQQKIRSKWTEWSHGEPLKQVDLLVPAVTSHSAIPYLTTQPSLIMKDFTTVSDQTLKSMNKMTTNRFLGRENKGYEMALKLGWNPARGLGKNEDGPVAPVEVLYTQGTSGLGSVPRNMRSKIMQVCEICNHETNINEMKTHLLSKKHLKKASLLAQQSQQSQQSQQTENSTEQTESQIQDEKNNNNKRPNAENLEGPPQKKKKIKKRKNENIDENNVCDNVSDSISDSNIDNNDGSPKQPFKHKQKKLKVPPTEIPMVHCEACKLDVKQNEYNVHLITKKHKKNQLQFESEQPSIVEQLKSNIYFSSLLDPAVEAANSEAIDHFCLLCHAHISSENVYTNHVSGKKHRQNEITIETTICCDACQIKVDSSKINMHLASPQHISNIESLGLSMDNEFRFCFTCCCQVLGSCLHIHDVSLAHVKNSRNKSKDTICKTQKAIQLQKTRHCDLCKVEVREVDWPAHELSKKHVAAVSKTTLKLVQ